MKTIQLTHDPGRTRATRVVLNADDIIVRIFVVVQLSILFTVFSDPILMMYCEL
jgi:hypothetical protein